MIVLIAIFVKGALTPDVIFVASKGNALKIPSRGLARFLETKKMVKRNDLRPRFQRPI